MTRRRCPIVSSLVPFSSVAALLVLLILRPWTVDETAEEEEEQSTMGKKCHQLVSLAPFTEGEEMVTKNGEDTLQGSRIFFVETSGKDHLTPRQRQQRHL